MVSFAIPHGYKSFVPNGTFGNGIIHSPAATFVPYADGCPGGTQGHIIEKKTGKNCKSHRDEIFGGGVL
jgi:hypothetical protein